MIDSNNPPDHLRQERGTCPALWVDTDGELVWCRRPVTIWCQDVTAGGVPLADLRRPTRRLGYCQEHGGDERAISTLLTDWHYLAPPAAGDALAVEHAGSSVLGTEHDVVTLRRVETSRTEAACYAVRLPLPVRGKLRVSHEGLLRQLGLWGGCRIVREVTLADRLSDLLWQYAQVRPAILAVAARTVAHRPWVAGIGVGSHHHEIGAYDTEREALDAATAWWRTDLAARVAEITALRGGTLAWGRPVEPRAEPVVLRPAPGESTWDAYGRRHAALDTAS